MAGEWRFNPSVHRAKGDRLVRARVLSVFDNVKRIYKDRPSNGETSRDVDSALLWRLPNAVGSPIGSYSQTSEKSVYAVLTT